MGIKTDQYPATATAIAPALKERHFEVFHAVMLTQSVTRAAENLRSSQPTVSRILGELERRIGFALFLRERRRMVPTPEAVLLFKEVNERFVGLDRLARAVRSIAAFDGQSLRIATIPSVSLGLIPLAVPAFWKRHPRARVSVDVQTYENVLARVVAGQCDIGFTAYPAGRLGVRSQDLVRTAAVCVLPAGHPLARRESIRAEDLRDQPFISLEGAAPSRQRIDQVFRERRVPRRLVLETQNGAMVCSLVIQGAGLSVVDPFSAYAFRDPALAVRPFRPTIEFMFNVIWRSDQAQGRLAAAFLDIVRETLEKRAAELPLIGFGHP